ncbi:hypothetical protein HAZT_HAZT003404 [Hyalella azteca]|uniref:Guanine nucleotide-binding protein subunit beta-like protein n=1 Tax=Hyalella azteca TaxID=294128 RepID=A0A6A0H636_HYAAZ|nr:hypothetical protein HAZT_HAZT003404 [Hyalella azteca]
MILRGHTRRVTCLLYPHGDAGGAPAAGAGPAGAGAVPTPRYPANQLVSGGADFAVIIWDLTTGAQLTRFVVQAGPVLQLMTTPSTCSVFSSRGHWEISSAVSTQHLVAVVALANTLQHRNAATLHPFRERSRRLHLVTAKNMSVSAEQDAAFRQDQSRIKQGWSTLTALHSVLLPDAVHRAGADAYKPPLLEVLARRWQSRCQEIRDAAQVLLQTELVRIGRTGRQRVIDEWFPHLPSLTETQHGAPANPAAPSAPTATATPMASNSQPINGTVNNSNSAANSTVVNSNSNNNSNAQNNSNNHSTERPQQTDAQHIVEDYHFDEDHLEGLTSSGGGEGSSGAHKHSQQGVAIVLLAVIGAYHGHHQEEGFSLGSPLAVKTSEWSVPSGGQ